MGVDPAVSGSMSAGWRRALNALGLGVMRVLAYMPLSWVRALGWLLGLVLHAVAARRRRIARVNWALCFPGQAPEVVAAAVRRHFVYFAQAWLDRSWLWHAPLSRVKERLILEGDTAVFEGKQPLVLLAPHFVGLDAGWTALTVGVSRRFSTIYAAQLNPDVDRWIQTGRLRFGAPHLVPRHKGVRPVVAALRAGEPLYLLPDMDYGPGDSVFVPFFGVEAATIPSLSRFAQLAKAQVVPVVAHLTPRGYTVQVLPAWTAYPTGELVADTALMNQRLEALITQAPEQYFWVHKRFKSRPPGAASVYGRD
jgi:KDO2-lipid IV(A) lauroyltransferase